MATELRQGADYSLRVFVADVATGQGLPSLGFAAFNAGAGGFVDISKAGTKSTRALVDGEVEIIDDTNEPGWYWLHLVGLSDFTTLGDWYLWCAVAGSSVFSPDGRFIVVTTTLQQAAANIASIKTKTDALPAAPADETLVIAATNAIMTRLGVPAGASIAADMAAVQSAINDIAADAEKLLGLSGYLRFIDQYDRNGNGTIIFKRIRWYDSQINFEAARAASPDDYNTGKLGEVEYRATTDSQGLVYAGIGDPE